jgi:hypothetical protein
MSPAGPYVAGQVVTVTYTLSSFTQVNDNWIIAFDIDYGNGWSSISPVSAPGNPGGSSGSWVWDTQNTYPSGLNFGPGYRFQNSSWFNPDFGTESTGPFTLSFKLTVGSSCLPQDLSIDLSVIGDCQTGGWNNGACCSVVPYSIYNGSSSGSGNISLTANPIDISCNGFSDGSINLNVLGGAGSYTYSWSNGAITPSINNLSAGSYSVTVTDAVGCTETINNIIINEPSLIQTTIVNTNVSCSGLSDGSSTINSTSTIVSYLWSDGQITQTASNLTAGTYSYTITDINGCSFSDNITVYEPSSLVVTLNTTDATCFGSSDGTASIDLQGSSTPPGTVSTLSYCASHPSLNPAFTTNNPIIEDVTLLGDNIDINSTSGAADFYEDYTALMYADLTQGQGYSISIILAGIGTIGNSTNLSGGKVYIDYNIDGDFTDPGEEVGLIPYRDNTTIGVPEVIAFTVPNTGVYGPTRMRVVSQYRSGQNSNLISSCDAPSVPSWNEPYYGATEDYSIVLNNPTSSATYSWFNGQTTDSISGLSAGSYWVNITDANGCVTTENFSISSGTPISVSADFDQSQCAGVVPNSLLALGSTAGTNYSWSPSADFINSNIQNPVFANGINTTSIYTVTFTDFNGCVATDSVTITVFPIITTAPINHN